MLLHGKCDYANAPQYCDEYALPLLLYLDPAEQRPIRCRYPQLNAVRCNSHHSLTKRFVMQVRSAGGKTLVHCVSGVSRSASLCLAYLMKHERMPLGRAFAHLKSRRPSIRPNTGFFTQLIEFERRVFGAATVSMVYNPAAGMLIPDVYEPEYQKMLWYQQHYSCSSVRHWWSVYWGILLWTGPQDCTDGFTPMRHIMRKTQFLWLQPHISAIHDTFQFITVMI